MIVTVDQEVCAHCGRRLAFKPVTIDLDALLAAPVEDDGETLTIGDFVVCPRCRSTTEIGTGRGFGLYNCRKRGEPRRPFQDFLGKVI